LVRAIDGELDAREAKSVERHLATCWGCRARKQEFEGAIADFVRVYQKGIAVSVPSPDGPRALLKVHLAELAAKPVSPWERVLGFSRTYAWQGAFLAPAVIVLAVSSWMISGDRPAKALAVAVPNPQLTPGARLMVSRKQVCGEPDTKNKTVPVALQ